MLSAEVRPNRRQWRGYAEPEENNQQQSAEWNGSRRTSHNQEQIQQEHDGEYHTEHWSVGWIRYGWEKLRWQDRGGKKRQFSLLRASQRRVYAASDITTHPAIPTSQRMLILTDDESVYPPKNVQQIIITVAMEPRFDGDRNPNNANTIGGQGDHPKKPMVKQT